jgi:hypothetical protein
MIDILVKGAVAGLLVAGVLAVQERSTALAAILVSLPITSIIALAAVWLDTGSRRDVTDLSWAILLIVLPSVLVFIALPLLMRTGLHFWPALLLACGVMACGYWLYAKLLARVGIG